MGRDHWDDDNVKYIDAEGRPQIETRIVPFSDDAAWVMGAHEGPLILLDDMAVPLARSTWPDDLGGRYYPAQRGNNSALWWEVRQPAAHGADLLCH